MALLNGKSGWLAAAACLVAATGLLAPGQAAAQLRAEPAGNVGPIMIDRAYEANRFNRCRAIFRSRSGDFILHFSANRTYLITLPSPPRIPNPLMVIMDLGRQGTVGLAALTDGNRVRANLDNATVQSLLRHRGPIRARVGDVQGEWPGAPMEEVFIAIENCVNRATGGR